MGDEVKKVGILNVQWVDNYGAVLLAYALQLTIDAMGYQAEIIDYRPVTVTIGTDLSSLHRIQFCGNAGV